MKIQDFVIDSLVDKNTKVTRRKIKDKIKNLNIQYMGTKNQLVLAKDKDNNTYFYDTSLSPAWIEIVADAEKPFYKLSEKEKQNGIKKYILPSLKKNWNNINWEVNIN